MAPEPDYSAMSTDIVLKGTLRKAKTWNKRFFVLRDGNPPKLEYYENERKWKVNKPKRQISLGNPWNIDKKKDTKHEFLIVIFTKDEYFTMAAESADVQQTWISALLKTVRPAAGLTMFKYIWQVVLENKELEMSSSNLSLHGQHRICLTHDSMVFVACNDRCNNTPAEILITNIRLCGHKENMFFIEPGRASGIGNGKLWMDVGDDAMAAQMHTTILNVMYALRQEEASCSYRGRSNSSGSNSSRTRTTRTHHNPPPSQIGMGKISSAKRNRCDSLPASHVVGLQDSRLRTGSEGENTMKRPLRYNSMRLTYGSTSPGMRNRLTPTYKRMSQHHVSHSHTSSLPGSCNSSSTASSTEHINHDFSSGYMSSSITCSAHTSEPTSADEYGSNSPTQTYIRKQQSSRSIADTQTACTPPIQEDGGYCPTCSHTFHPRHGTAPPPPDTQPPSNPLTHEYTNVPTHSRTHSLDDNLSCGTSSLSASPHHIYEAEDKHDEQTSKKESLDEYSVMEFNRNPNKSQARQVSPPQNGILAKFGWFGADSKVDEDVGYVPMKSVTTRSLPQEIEPRRKSDPDMTFSVEGAWSLYGSSPEKGNIKPRQCSSCTTDAQRVNSAIYTKMAPSSPHYNCHLKLSSDYTDMTPESYVELNEEYLSMKPLNNGLSNLKVKDPINISPDGRNDIEGYIPMSPVSAGNIIPGTRKSIVSSILSVAMEPPKPTPQYPHQLKSFSTQSLDRTNKKRPKSLGFRHTSSTRRSQSVKQNKKNIPPITISQGGSPPAKPPLSPGGDYVNIDFEKAQSQAQQSRYVEATNQRGSSYAHMEFTS